MSTPAKEPQTERRAEGRKDHRPWERSCPHCAYGLTGPTDADNSVVCVNHPESPGQLRQVAEGTVCRNFRRRCPPRLRLEPPEPPSDEIRYIGLTQGKFAIVDAADYPRLSRYKWYAARGRGDKYYAMTSRPNGRPIRMHRLLMNPPAGLVVDHVDGNGLNNRRCNLRICTPAENTRNRPARIGSSRFKGVCLDPRRHKYGARLCVNGHRHRLGAFADEIEAAIAYDLQAVTLAGRFAYLNFPHIIAQTTQAKNGRRKIVKVRTDQ